MKLRDYQEELSSKACQILDKYKIVYIAMETRTGKTITALSAAKKCGFLRILFVTKKKAIGSVVNDTGHFPDLQVVVINYESLHKIEGVYDLIIVDEAHSIGAFPKPAKRVKDLLQFTKNKPIILLSATPTPESFSQIYHQLFISSYSPFKEYKSFYKWAKDFVKVKKKYIYNREINDYSTADIDKITSLINHLFINFTQEEAGFEYKINEVVLKIKPDPKQIKAIEILKRDLVLPTKSGDTILADTAVKLQNKIHQICSGTVIAESGKSYVITKNKALFIKEYFKDQKIAIFYKFKQEFEILKQLFPHWTSSPEEFQSNKNKTFLSQFQSGREGIRLDSADSIIFYNIDFSYLSYAQARERIISKERKKEANLYWIFIEGGIEEKIYKIVNQKKDYTVHYFKKDFLKK